MHEALLVQSVEQGGLVGANQRHTYSDTYQLCDFGVAFGELVVLASIDLSLSKRGVHVIVGPSGSGKSTLLRTLAGLNDAQPIFRTWGARSHALEQVPLVAQHARLLLSSIRDNLVCGLEDRHKHTQIEQNEILGMALERAGLGNLRENLGSPVFEQRSVVQRCLAVVRELLSDPHVLMVDEPTAELSDEDAELLIALLRQEAETRLVIVVTHNQKHARSLGGTVSLLAGGRIQETAPSHTFFSTPTQEVTAQFVRTGGCHVASPNAKAEELAPDMSPPLPLPLQAKAIVSGKQGPRDFYWLEQGRIAGMPRPGIVADLEYDLNALRELDISVLVTLEEKIYFDVTELQTRDIEHIFLPVVDMEVPTATAALQLCSRLHQLLGLGRSIALHCRAGKGRTGTLLACYRIYRGASAVNALADVRRINPRWIQSDAQVQFLSIFEQHVLGVSAEASGAISQTTEEEKEVDNVI